MLFSKPQPHPEAVQSEAARSSGSKDGSKGPKSPNRRWFSTFRPKQLPEKGVHSNLPGAESSRNQDRIDTRRKLRPVTVNHRRSLSSVFKTVKTRYSRDILDKNENNEWQSFTPPHVFQLPELLKQDMPVFTPRPRKASPPPCLDMPSDLVARDMSSGTSTFRANLEKAVDDINNKYRSPSSAESCKSYVIRRGLEQKLQEVEDRPIPMPISFPLGNFRPRYQLPTFMDAPAPKAKSTVGEVRDLSAIPSPEPVPMEVDVEGKDDGGCHLPTLLLDEVADSSFSLDELMTTMTSQTAPQETAPPRISAENGDLSTRASCTCPSSQDSIHDDVREPSGNDLGEGAHNLNGKAGEPEAIVVTTNMSSTTSSTYNSDCLSLAQKTPLPLHQRQRANSEQATCTTRGSSIRNFDGESLFSEVGIEVKRLRPRSIPDNSECVSVMTNSRQPSNTSDGLAFSDDTIPSVSDLVRKFRRLGSMPGEFPPASLMEAPKQYPAMRNISRGKQFERFRNRFSSESEASSVLSCRPGLTNGELRPVGPASTIAHEVEESAEM
ncbi:hypothetical protein E4U41_001767 [Claviceps citrina]|nr:hypothetical protein E4U41_001767 [Claviceps citrina]